MTLAAEETGVLGLRRGADRELDRLFRRYGVDVRRQVRVLVRNPSDVEDIVQQTFLKALAALHRGQRPRLPRQWLLAIARNECLMHYRTEARRPAVVALDDELDAAVPSDGARAAEIREALAQLRPAQRDALVLRELEGRSYTEIAAALDLSIAAVETLLFRARRALREQLEHAGGCIEASALLAADVLTDAQRRFLRAHVRGCAACATLERRRRGRRAALKRIAGVLPMPQWLSPLFGGGVKAIAVVAAAALAAGGTAELVHSNPLSKPKPTPRTPPITHRDAVRHEVGGAPARVSVDPAVLQSARRAAPPPAVTRPPAEPGAAVVPPAEPAGEHPRAPRPPQPAPPGPAAAPADSGPLPSVTAPTATTTAAPSVTVPELTAPAVTVPAAPPAATVPSVTVPAATTPVATTPTVTTPTLTVP